MRRLALALAIAGLPAAAPAGIVAARTLPAGTVIEAGDISIAALPDGLADDAADPARIIGRQARTTIYEGRPVQPANLVTPTLVDRNALVTVIYTAGALSISTEGRALGKGGAGDTIPVLNVASRVTLSARINPDGTLTVLPRP